MQTKDAQTPLVGLGSAGAMVRAKRAQRSEPPKTHLKPAARGAPRPLDSPSGPSDLALFDRAALLAWYDSEHRDLPWRRGKDPYAIWVSEVMLQQTQVQTVIPYFEQWMRTFPSLESLARANESEVLKAWQGLGYYARAKRLLAGAREVLRVHDGHMPKTATELMRLPGVGSYTAGAVASIAFGEQAPILDGNVTRVLCRVFGLGGDPSRAPLKGALWELARRLVHHRRPGDLNQAMMELGATLCTPRDPECPRCPLRKGCSAKKLGLHHSLPELRPRAKATPVSMVAALISDGRRFLMWRAREDAPWWASLWQFPNLRLLPEEEPPAGAARLANCLGVRVRAAQRLAGVKHSVTRYRVHLEAFTLELKAKEEPRAPTHRKTRAKPKLTSIDGSPLYQELRWCDLTELEALAMPAPHVRLLSFLSAKKRR